jgi:hypothetical protein
LGRVLDLFVRHRTWIGVGLDVRIGKPGLRKQV